jgi:anthranilate phosphoribosyltransferase
LFDNQVMSISHYLKEIGRGKHNARDLTREQACDLMGQLLDGSVTDVETGAFCIAMRVKGETSDELAGFMDALNSRMKRLSNPSPTPIVVLPSYNGARRLPLLTPLLALLLAEQGLQVVVHGGNTEDSRLSTAAVMNALGIPASDSDSTISNEPVVYVPTEQISQGLWRLLQVRRTIGLRNSSHSLVKMLSPVNGAALLVSSYTHPEYETVMLNTLQTMKAHAMLLRGTEGEPVADPRRLRKDIRLLNGQVLDMHDPDDAGSVETLELPLNMSAEETAAYIRALIKQPANVPLPIQTQVKRLVELATRITTSA